MTVLQGTRPRVNAGRLVKQVARLGAIGAVPGGGVTRLAFTPETWRVAPTSRGSWRRPPWPCGSTRPAT